jgi:hypothetical protein
MARKHSRTTRPNPSNETAVIAQSAVTSLKRASPKTPDRGESVKASSAAPPSFGDTPLGRLLTGLFWVFSSLQLAICLLSVFTLCLIEATLLESNYSTKIAQDLVYRTWWFAFLLALLSTNVLCAALKKYPWKKYQTGFLITHSGLLTLMFGSLLTVVGGTDGQMIMIDSDHPGIQAQSSLSRTTRTVYLPDEQSLKVWQLRKPKDFDLNDNTVGIIQRMVAEGRDLKKHIWNNQWDLALNPGSFTWHDDDMLETQLPLNLRLLQRLAAPLPGFSRALDDRTTLVVKNFFAHTESVRYSPAPKGDEGFPALKVELRSSVMGVLPEKWVGAEPLGKYELRVALVEMMSLRDPVLLPEFLDPPAPETMGKLGQIVLVVEGKTFRLPVDKDRVGKTLPLEGTGREFILTEYADNFAEPEVKVPEYPAVKFTVSGQKGNTEYAICARLPQLVEITPAQGERFPVWYHFPDFRWGDPQLNGNLQFLGTPEGKVYYRVYGRDGLQQKGQELDPNDRDATHPCWKSMNFRFRIADYLPRAIAKRRIVPQNCRPGLQKEEFLPAVRCALVQDGKSSEDFLVRLGGLMPEKVRLGDEWFFVQYGMATREMNFSLTLKQAQQVNDPGTERAASFSSDVVLSYERKKGEKITEDHHIWMNNPLEFGPYKVYQTNYERLDIDPNTGKLVSKSALTVANDPGLWFKYAGSLIVVLGIMTMFYMKAYFFKPRGQRTTKAEPVPEAS